MIAAVAIPILLLALAAICGNMIQPRPAWPDDAPMPKLNRISPMAGINHKAVAEVIGYAMRLNGAVRG